MLRLTARHSGTATRVLREAVPKRRHVTVLPRGMYRYQPPTAATDPHALPPDSSCSSSTVGAAAAAGDDDASSTLLPPWPTDAIEFNALAVDGGQGAREAWQLRRLLAHCTAAASTEGDDVLPVPKTMLLTVELLQQLAAAEETPAAQSALAVGGWVCTGCWSIQGTDSGGDDEGVASTLTSAPVSPASPSSDVAPRTVCATCHTLRHDVQTWPLLSSFLQQRQLWHCRQCGEVNPDHPQSEAGGKALPAQTPTCRCCGHVREAEYNPSHREELRQTVVDETAQNAVGHIVVTRNRTTRWRCGGCGEVNSLQRIRCRNCDRERFALTVSCPQCAALRVLSNECAYGADSATRRTFMPANCYSPLTTQLDCLQCGSPLHGGAIQTDSVQSAAWWCACGVSNPSFAYSCYRCRLPQTVSSPTHLRALLRSATTTAQPRWDFATCTSWFCDSCEGVNDAAYEVVAENRGCGGGEGGGRASTSPSGGPHPKQRRRWKEVVGETCKHCGAPWHHQLLQGGEWWRCACHAVNKGDNSLCTSCQLPGQDEVSSIVLSSWARGDWVCHLCGTHCFRERLQCRCGADRPSS